MSLAGLLTALDDDPQLHSVVTPMGYANDAVPSRERDAATLTGNNLVAPPTLRPVVSALSPVSGTPGPAPTPPVRPGALLLIVLVTSPRVVPGLLGSTRRPGRRCAPPLRCSRRPAIPRLPALDDAAIAYRVVDEPDVSRSTRTKLWYGCAIRVPTRRSRQALSGCTVRPTCPMRTWSTSLPPWTGCASNVPWAGRQTHASLALHLLEEPYEALEALECGAEQAFREELGDVLLQVVFHTRVAAECDDGTGFNVDDVAEGIVGKLVRRHPHVLGDGTVSGADEVKRNWDEIKREEKEPWPSNMGGLVRGRPLRSFLTACRSGSLRSRWPRRLQRRATRAGLSDELARLDGDEDIGGELFRLVAKAREEERDPEMELRVAVGRWEQSAESC